MSGFYTSDAEQQQTIGRLRYQSVPFVLLIEDVELNMPCLSSYIETHYQPMAHIAVPDTRGVQVYVARGRQHRGTDRSTGWPCFQ